jgi:predicted transposase/invertase (TIGR01784 family)
MLWGEYNYDEDIAAQRQEAFDDGLSKGVSQGSQKAKIETAKNAIAMHLKTEEIVKLTGLSVDVIQSLQNN